MAWRCPIMVCRCLSSLFVVLLSVSVFLIANVTYGQDNVVVTVSATNPGNTPVSGLGKADFSVQDSGKPQSITTFAGSTGVSAPAKLGPNEFSNIPDFRESSGAVFGVFDTIHTRYIDERDERVMVLKFLGKAAQAKHAVSMELVRDKGLTVYHDYRSGSDVLLAA